MTTTTTTPEPVYTSCCGCMAGIEPGPIAFCWDCCEEGPLGASDDFPIGWDGSYDEDGERPAPGSIHALAPRA